MKYDKSIFIITQIILLISLINMLILSRLHNHLMFLFGIIVLMCMVSTSLLITKYEKQL